MVGAILLSPTDAGSQEPIMGSAQRVVVARTRAPRYAAVQHCLEYLGSEHSDVVSRGAIGRSCSSRVFFWKLHHALRTRHSTSMHRSALWLTFPSRHTNSFVWLYTRPAASTLNMAVDSGISFTRKHMISVLTSHDHDHPIIFLSCSGGCETTPASSV